jgi:hypothetical protein
MSARYLSNILNAVPEAKTNRFYFIIY